RMVCAGGAGNRRAGSNAVDVHFPRVWVDDGRARAVAAENDPPGDRARSEDRAEVERRPNHPRPRGASAWPPRQRRAVSGASEIVGFTQRRKVKTKRHKEKTLLLCALFLYFVSFV